MRIRPIELKDVPRCAEIHVFGWRNAYRGIIPDDYLFNTLIIDEKRLAKWEDYVHKPETDTERYLYDDGLIKGILTIGKCRDDDKSNAFELMGIYVEPLMKRQGIGTELAKFCEHRAKELGYGEIYLWVFADNAESRKFYEKMGYRPDGVTKIWDRIPNITPKAVRYRKTI